jgi:DinB superfamily
MAEDEALREHVVKLLKGGDAHVTFENAIKDFPAELRGEKPKGAEHSSWEVLEHLRIALWDILDFSVNPEYKEREWPKEYWPETAAPPNPQAWDESVLAFEKHLQAMCDLVENEKTDLFAKIPHGTGQTILREALVVADHNGYHLGEIVLLRRVLGAWK